MSGYTPAQVVERTGLTQDTLRYYEREQLIGPVDRTSGGHRHYTENDVAWIGIITCLRDAGLGIAELRRFTELLRTERDPQDRVSFLQARRVELQEQRDRLSAALVVLDDKIAHYGKHR